MDKIQVDALDTGTRQAESFVTAMAIKCPGCREFQSLVVEMLEIVLDHPWVDVEVEYHIRRLWAKIADAEVVNDDL
jgi:hypothetical protein